MLKRITSTFALIKRNFEKLKTNVLKNLKYEQKIDWTNIFFFSRVKEI